MPAIELTNITKVYQKDFWAPRFAAVDDLSFSINEHRIIGFVGPNGAGKTTTIKMIMGLVHPTKGKILINGLSAQDPNARRKMAYLSELPYFYKHLSILESLQFTGKLLGNSHRELKEDIGRVLAKTDLTGREKSKIRELSKGMMQRLNMATALLGNPELLILDEPMSGMDPPGRRLFREVFREQASQGKTIFFSTHVLEDIESVCDEVVVLSKGKLSQTGEVDSLISRGFLGTELTVDAVIMNELVDELSKRGYMVTFTRESTIIYVPRELELKACQIWLNEHQLYCSSIQKRSMPLETLLYKKE